jgi:hypothetical protein
VTQHQQQFKKFQSPKPRIMSAPSSLESSSPNNRKRRQTTSNQQQSSIQPTLTSTYPDVYLSLEQNLDVFSQQQSVQHESVNVPPTLTPTHQDAPLTFPFSELQIPWFSAPFQSVDQMPTFDSFLTQHPATSLGSKYSGGSNGLTVGTEQYIDLNSSHARNQAPLSSAIAPVEADHSLRQTPPFKRKRGSMSKAKEGRNFSIEPPIGTGIIKGREISEAEMGFDVNGSTNAMVKVSKKYASIVMNQSN